jgi:NAD-dependent deacetylase
MSALESAAQAVCDASSVVAVTGAGISVESGIPDFRSADGLWSKYPPDEYATIEAFHENPDKVWEMWFDLAEMLGGVQPNPAHKALAELERRGQLQAVITQNIDNLHQTAGNHKVIEYHGNAEWIFCEACHRRRPLGLTHRAHGAPRCECGGIMKPDVVFFGEVIPPRALLESEALAQTCDVIIVVGTSAKVYPAAGIPFTAKEFGAFVIECNTEETEFTSTITDAFLQGPAGTTLPELVARVREL